ncbi:hypothetical protein VP1G_04223 [Cytospora mali]|uniref:Uncharacterized protein n=1 Tax=Cytospora mali TaxID=578113 RepID=A0A194UZ17_CYTMA|nr:hypothetical protein VP1G_04223 [Valsa mali var. pyri (nom. inval.)]
MANSNETDRIPTTYHAGIIQGATLKPLEADHQTPLKFHESGVFEYSVGNSSASPEVPFPTAEDRTMKSRGGGSPPRSFEIPPDDTTEDAGSGDYLPRLSPETMDRIVQMGRNSPGSKPELLSTGPPVSYIPADHPGGPRDLPSGRYRCPVIECYLPFGPANEGYDRGSLAHHIDWSHRGPDEMWDAREQIRARLMDLRFEQGRGLSRTLNGGRVAHGFYQEIDELIGFLDEIRELEDSRRFVVPQVVQFSSVRNTVLKRWRLPPDEDEVGEGGGQGEGGRGGRGGGGGWPTSRPRANRFMRRRDEGSLRSRERACSPRASSGVSSLAYQRIWEASRVKSPEP